MPSAWLRRNVFHPCEGGPLLRAMYLATLVWPTSIPSLRSSPWILGAPHNGLAMLISRISRRISNSTVARRRLGSPPLDGHASVLGLESLALQYIDGDRLRV